ncbi:MAG: hypothetical protein AAF610_08590 [Pseudomonadota bacterium]
MNDVSTTRLVLFARVVGVSAILGALSGCGGGAAEGAEGREPPPGISFSASPQTVASGGTTQLTWNSTGADNCTASGGWAGSKGTRGEETTAAISADTTFDLTCAGAGGQTARSVTVSVAAAAPPTLNFSASPPTVIVNGSAQLSWVSENTTSCTASGAWSGQKVLAGSASTGSLTNTSEFVLTCEGDGGSVTRAVTVTVATPSQPTLSFSAAPAVVEPNAEATLSWSSANTTSCTASGGWSGDRALSGSVVTGPLTQDASFTLTCIGQSGSIARTVDVEVRAAGASRTITTFQLDDGGSAGARPVTIGVPLAEGELASGAGLVVARADGTLLPSQWSPLASWRTDGTQLHGALTFVTDGAASASGQYEVRTGTSASGAAISRADVTSAGFDARIQVVSGGNTYVLSARDLLDGTVSARLDHTHFAGPLASEFVVGGPLRVNGRGTAHPSLQAYFHVRAFQRPVQRVYVTAVLENTGVFTSLSDVTGDVTITVDGQTRYQADGFTVGADKRYPKRFWWNGDPELWAQLDGEYLQDTRLVPEYRTVDVANETLNSFPDALDWHERGQLAADMSGGGAALYLAPLDRWSASYLISGDRRAFNGMRAHGDAYHWVVSKHSYAMNPRDENTGFPLDLAANPSLIGNSWGGPNAIAAARQSGAPLQTDMAHQPSCNYVLYLVTAEYGALEHCQMWGVANWIMERPGSYSGWPRSFFAGQVRGVGWGYRNVVLAATATPDSHPLKDTLTDAVSNAIDSFEKDARVLDPSGNLGLWLTEGGANAIIYDAGTTPNPGDTGPATGVAPWQDDFLTWAIGFSHQLGFAAELNSDAVWGWKAQSIVERAGDGSAFCWASGASYSMGVRDAQSASIYPDWATVYERNFPSEGACPGNGEADAGVDRTPTDYGAQMGAALSVAVASGVPGAAAAWTRYDARDTNWGDASFELSPEWALEPAAVSGASVPAADLTLTPDRTVVEEGQTVSLTWASTSTSSCTAAGAWSGPKPVSGSETVGPLSQNASFELTCAGPGGTVFRGVRVFVVPAAPVPGVTFSASATTVEAGDSTELSWSTTNASGCRASGDWSGARATSGTETVGPLAADSRFVLECSGPGGVTVDAVDVNVTIPPPPPALTIEASPSSVAEGGRSTVTWSSQNVTQCLASGRWFGFRPLSGSVDTGALMESATYTLSCDGPGGAIERSVTVTVNPAPTVSLTANPTSVAQNTSSTLSWSSQNATACTASGGWSGARATSGTESTGALTSARTYQITCSGAGGEASATATVTILPSPTLSFSASPNTVTQGESAILSWTTSNATECTASGDWSGLRGVSGSTSTGALSQTSDYTLSCSGAGGTVARTVTVNVNAVPAPTLTLTATPESVLTGQSSTLSWSSGNANSCVASGGWSGSQSLSGSVSTGALSSTTSFTLNCSNASRAVSRSVTVNVSSGSGGAVITSFSLDDADAGPGRAVTFGVPIAEGAVASGTDLIVTRTDGTVLTSQWNPLASWRTDGSALHGALTFLTPDAGDNSGAYQVRTGTPSGGSTISRADVVSAGFDAEVQINVGATAYRLSAADLLDGTVAPRQDYTHFTGPLAAEFIVGGALRVNGTGAQHPTLQAYFHVRAFQRPVSRVHVTTVLENTGVFNAPADTTGDVTITVGGTPRYTNAGFEVDADKRYPKRFWWNGDPGLWVQHDTEYVQDTRLVPEYRELTVSAATLNGFPSSIDWDGRGQLNAALAGGGAALHLAPLDHWSAAYLISGDRRAFDGMRAHGDAYHWVVSTFDYAMNPRDENTGFPINMANNPTAIGRGWGGPNAIASRRLDQSPMSTDMAHQPSCNYVLYLTTAEYDALEHCQLWGVANWIMERPGSFPTWPRSFYIGQVRSIGWGFRNMVMAAIATPDAHPLKATLDQSVTFAIDSFQNDARALDPNDNLGAWLTSASANAIIYDSATTPNPSDTGPLTGIAPWQDDFVTWSMGFAHHVGYAAELDADGVWAWKAQAIVERLGDGSAYCWSSGANFALGVRSTSSSALFSSWADVFNNNYPGAGACPSNGGADAGVDRAATDYGAQMGAAIAVATSTGIANAAAAWTRYDTRTTAWNPNEFQSRPEWAIKP